MIVCALSPSRRERRRSNAAGIGIACVRRNQCLGHDVRGRREVGEKVQNLRSQLIRIAGVEQARYRWRSGCHALQSACILCCFRQITISNMFLKLRPSAT